MRDYLVSYLRLFGFSVCTLAVALCVRFGPAANAATLAPEPRFSAPPPEADMAALPLPPTEEELDVLGPLPDHPGLFIPVMLSGSGDSTPADTARRFSPVVRSGNPHCGMTHAGLAVIAGLQRRTSDIGGALARYDAPPHNVRMAWYDAEDATLAALCVELSGISGPPRVVAPIRTW
jgi:hypothetical protein